MATKDPQIPGLLSKVAKFVRNPTTNWSDLDKLDAEPEQGYSKQALKEMIERKRQNDFVRKREFDHLRKLRNRDPSLGSPELAGRPSYFQSSMPSNPGERAMTIKKIDEIEAQMSNQWWQGKGSNSGKGGFPESKPGETPPPRPDAALAKPAEAPAPAAGDPAVDPAYAPTKVAGLASDPAYAPTKVAGLADGAYAPTALAPVSDISYEATRQAPMGQEAPEADPADFAPTQTHSGFGNTQGGASAESVELVADPELEEAAIRFANGDHEGAENSLLTALREGGGREDQSIQWHGALFDLYRAIGDQERFDRLAIGYAERSGRSAPSWFSIPERLGLRDSRALARTQPSRLHDDPLWYSPAQFDRSTVDQLQLAVANAPQPFYLDWSALQEIRPDAFEPLAALFGQWCGTTVMLRFAGTAALERVLRTLTTSGNRGGGQAPWRLRLEALRLIGLQDEFELVALDYCVTFEVSPPPWQDVRCRFEREQPAGGEAAVSVSAALGGAGEDTESAAEAGPLAELAGEIVGEATEALARLDAARAGGSRLAISCANLIRVDFSAAGSILNWVAARQGEGCRIQFRETHRLVAAFFHVIGINEHARIVLRTN